MSKYAKLENNVVTNIILCEDSNISMMVGEHMKITQETGQASIGGSFNYNLNKFIAPKPYESWVLNSEFNWESPAGANPNILTKMWDEEAQAWIDRP